MSAKAPTIERTPAEAPARARGMTPEDVYELTGVADPRVSPDGRLAAAVVWWIDREENEYRSAIWLVRLDGSSPPRQFTSGAKRDAAPRWSPDGSRLAFVSNRERKALQLYVIPAQGGEPRRLTDLDEDVEEAAWSPDGSRLAFSSRVRDEAYGEEDDAKRGPRRFRRLQYKLDNVGWTGDRRRHLFTVAADGSAQPSQLTSGDFEDATPAWSPDGRQIAFVSDRDEDWDLDLLSDVYVVAADGGEPRRLTGRDGGWAEPAWSPDGSRIVAQYVPGVWDEPRHPQIGFVDVTSGEHRLLTEALDRSCAPYPEIRGPMWEDEAQVLFGLEDRGNTHLYRARADGSGTPELVIGGEIQLSGYDAAAGTIVHTQATASSLSELYVGERQLTDVGRAFAAGRELVEPERFTAVSADGSEVEAWIMRPAGFEPGRHYPVLLNIHGGPFTQYGSRFMDEFHVYAGAGYAVLFSNPRGSSGYTEAWGRAIRGPLNEGPGWGTVDYEDLMAVTDEALRRFDFCDPDRLGVIGGSYGGYMTSWIVGHTDRFKAAISERAVNNWISDFGSSDFGWAFKGYFGAFQFEAVDEYLEHSPTTYAERIATPLLILHSENDLRCNVEQAEWLFTVMRLLKKEVEFVRFPAESHELTRSGSPRHRVTRFEIVLDWFGRYLQP